jgi:predicted amidohydrolase YtcJ
MKRRFRIIMALQFLSLSTLLAQQPSPSADLVLFNGKVITMDQHFTIAEAVAVKEDKIIAVGTTKEIKKFTGTKTEIIDLAGKTVVPGLIDFHTHADGAAVSELNETIPDVHTVTELLAWIKNQTIINKKGEWIIHPKIFFTRLKELRQPSLSELDSVAPHHPVFLNGSYGGMINTAAMKASNITNESSHPGLVRDKQTGSLSGFIRASAFGLVKIPSRKPLSQEQRLEALQAVLQRYNQYGITSICSGGGDYKLFNLYQQLSKQNKLTTRIYQNIIFNTGNGITNQMLIDTLKSFKYVTGDGDSMVRIGAFKITLDGGILTGTAFMREPWGEKARTIFGIDDPAYRGVVNYSREDLFSIVKAANDLNWKFTAHCTGGGGVDLLLDVFEEVNKVKPIKPRRFSIIHGNFFTPEAIRRMKALGVCADMQPAWFYKDADAMKYILGEKIVQTFHPYKSLLDAGVIVNGGSDHMVKWDANTSVNPYNPFLAMWAMITRITERGTVINPKEAVSREQALKAYTVNNAYGSFEENLKGSIEKGKLADMAVLSDDILTCPVNQIKNIQSELTLLGGKVVYSSGKIHSGNQIINAPASSVRKAIK